MKIVKARPPIYDECVKTFGELPRGVIFAWGNTIFNPDGGIVTVGLVAHEEVHSRRQAGDPAGWWKRYLAHPDFRLEEELPAHKAEFWRAARGLSAADRMKMLAHVAERLSSKTYGHLIDLPTAKRLILGGSRHD